MGGVPGSRRGSCGPSALSSSSCRPFPSVPLPFPSLRQALRPVSRPCRLPASFLPAIVALPPAGKRLRPASPAGLPAAGRAGRAPRRRGAPPGWRPLGGAAVPGPRPPSSPPPGLLPLPAPGLPLPRGRPGGRGRQAAWGRGRKKGPARRREARGAGGGGGPLGSPLPPVVLLPPGQSSSGTPGGA